MFESDNNNIKPVAVQKTTCLCQTLRVALFWTRICGLSPISWINPKKSEAKIPHKCVFVVSKPWKIYCAWWILVYCMAYYSFTSFDFKAFSYPALLEILNNSLYATFGFVLTVWGFRNVGQLVEALNEVAVYVQDGWLCDGSKACVRATVWQGIVAVMLQLSLQFATYMYMSLHNTSTKDTNPLDLGQYLIHNVPFMFYYLFCTVSSIMLALFSCFDTKLSGVLQVPHISRHCSAAHEFVGEKSCRAAQIDQLRRIHEQIRTTMMDFNAAMNPQILIHQFIELLVIVMHLYSIIMFFGLPVRTPELYATFLMDCLFVVVHVCALVIFFSSADRIKSSQSDTLDLIKSAMRNEGSATERGQLRIFELKLKVAPARLSAGKFFIIEIALLAPICESIVTYLLVALQFKITAEGPAQNLTQQEP